MSSEISSEVIHIKQYINRIAEAFLLKNMACRTTTSTTTTWKVLMSVL